MAHNCARCSTEAADAKRCAGCKNTWYCSTECQKKHWPWHIFDCKTDKPIDTAYHLARSCFASVIPPDKQTRSDYGLDRAASFSQVAMNMAFDLWIEILVHRAVPPQEVRKWRKEGRLLDGVKGVYEALPPGSRGVCYPWLLQHEWVLNPSTADEAMVHRSLVASVEKGRLDTWAFIGGSPKDTHEEVMAKVHALPPARQLCFSLYLALSLKAHPHPIKPSSTEDACMTFGFIVGKESQLALSYEELIRQCTFDDFCAAFETSTLPLLFDRYRIPVPARRFFLDVMAGSPRSFKSVWYLKLYTIRLFSARGTGDALTPMGSVAVDYGFANCKNEQDRKLLDDLYKRLFSTDGIDPLALHDACMRGQLVEYAKSLVKLAPNTAKYTRLLKNRYPVREV